MNYCTEAIPQIFRFVDASRKLGYHTDAHVASCIIQDLLGATKFLLPPPDRMNVKVTGPALKFLKLPYPVCAFEYACPDGREDGIKSAAGKITTSKSTKRIGLAYDCSKDVGPVSMLKKKGMIPENAKGILVISLFYLDKYDHWGISQGGGYIDESVAEEMDFMVDNVNIRGQYDIVPLMYDSLVQDYGNKLDNALGAILNDTADEVAMVTKACLLLNARNLREVTVVKQPSHKLNKKRAQTGKAPFFEYRTIDIFVSASGKRVDRKKVNYGQLAESFKNMHLDRKWGTVIGHMKVRSTGVFWWNEHARGNSEKGIVQKDYRFKVLQEQQ